MQIWFKVITRSRVLSSLHRPAFGSFGVDSSPRPYCSFLRRMSNIAQNQYRLPAVVKPTHYDVTIRTDLEKLEFQGFVKISLDINNETSCITLNSSELKLSKTTIHCDHLPTPLESSSQQYDATQERIRYDFPTLLPSGSKAELRIGFEGKLTSGMVGYYRSSYEHNGETRYYALTQFEPTSARRAFPCWDEPLLKSAFTINMISREGTTNISNMPAVSEAEYDPQASIATDDSFCFLSAFGTPTERWKITRFQTTPLMSSYIVAFANGPFEYLERTVKLPLSQKVIPLRIYATGDLIHQARFALDVKADVLPLYEKVFDVAYPLPKLDTLVASDFDAGAMENWGLITGRTSAFLLDPQKADLSAKKNVLKTQSHEVAHMWFGNITTMEWWNYLYLNEGFATLMGEVIIADKVFPEWKVDSSFITEHLNRALSLDAKPSSHPIEVDCPDANKINQIFDALSYSKAASVLRMLANYVGEENFLRGVSIYLKKRLYGNSVTKDLWEGISVATGLDIVNLMENWISKIGFPVLTVTENSNGLYIRQDRFLETGLAEGSDNEVIWNVPLGLLTIDDKGNTKVDKTLVLKDRTMSIPLDIEKPFKLNAGTTGVYRVLYTPERLEKIAEEAAKQNSPFSLNDRLGLIHDSMALSKAGLAKLSSALTLVDRLKCEKEYLVWSGISENISTLVSIWWEYPDIIERMNAFRRVLFVPLVNQLGYGYEAKESPDTTSLRTCAITEAALAGDSKTIQELRERFNHYMKTGDDTRIPADLQNIIFKMAVKYGGIQEYEEMQKIHDKPKTPTMKLASISAMGASEDPELIEKTFKFISSNSRDQDALYFFRGLESNFKARRALARFFKDEYETLYKRFENNFMLTHLISYSFGGLSTQKDHDEVADFFKDKDTSKYSLKLAQTLDTILSKTAFIERSTSDLQDWEGLRQQERSRDSENECGWTATMPAFDPVRDALRAGGSNIPLPHLNTARRATDLSVLLNDPEDMRIPYNPKSRISPPGLVMIPLTEAEMDIYKSFRGQGAARLLKRKRQATSDTEDEPPTKKLAGDVGVVVEHYNSRPDVGVVQRSESPIIGLKNFNNWVKSVLITRFAHSALAQGSSRGARSGPGRAVGKVLDMGCGKGGDMTKWAKARVNEYYGVDIAANSVEQARKRWETRPPPRFDAKFAAMDCYTETLAKAFTPAMLSQPFDVVSMQFCMHYAFETVQKARCMLENVTKYLRPGGVFIGTIPNSDFLLEQMNALPTDAEKLSFGNSVYKITFEKRTKGQIFGHKYWFFLRDAVDNVPEYVVYWDNFVQMAAEYKLRLLYKQDFHRVYEEHQDHKEFGPLMVRMKVVDSDGASAMDEDQWEAANLYIAFAFEKQ